MKLELYTDRDSFTKEEIEYFWKSGISLDDWDYMIFFPPEILEEYEEEEEDYSYELKVWEYKRRKITVKKYRPKDYAIERLLRGCYDNKWYKINFRGAEIAIGIAYHA